MDAIPALWDDHIQRTAAKAQGAMQRQQAVVVATALTDKIPAGDAEVYAAIADAHGDIAGALEQHRQAGHRGDRGGELPWVWLIDAQTGVGHKAKRILGDASLTRERKPDIGAVEGHVSPPNQL